MAYSTGIQPLIARQIARNAPSEAFDRVVALAASLFAVPVALITILDDHRQWVKSKVGTDFSGGPREQAICRFVIDNPDAGPLVIPDLASDPRFSGSPCLTASDYRFYAGAPLVFRGVALGTLVLLDHKPRPAFSAAELSRFADLAALVIDALTLRAEHNEAEENQRLLTLAESVAGVGHWRYSVADETLHWSDEVYRIHGVSRDDFRPGLADGIGFYLPDDRLKVVEALHGALRDRAGFDLDLQIMRRDGAVRSVEARAVVELDESGAVAALFGTFRDVTDRLAVVEELRKAREQTETTIAARNTFLANMSHEFRTPLNSIIGYAELLSSTLPEGSTTASQAGMIGTAGHNLLALVDDVLDMARLDNGTLPLRANAFSPLALAEETVGFLQLEAERRGLTLTLRTPHQALPNLVGDSDRLRQILLNLIGNAIKFTQAGSVEVRLSVRAGQGDAALVLQVVDTGSGIPADKLGRLFRRFGQVENGFGPREGTGLGLAITNALVEAMGGSITVRSWPGQGSIFTVDLRLPLEEVRREAETSMARAIGTAVPILVAEDLAINRELIRVMLADLPIEIDFVEDGLTCVDQVKRRPYGLVLMDVRMPKLDGYGATEAIRALGGAYACLPIVALTASVMPEELARARKAGMFDHIEKPFSMAPLRAKVSRWLRPSEPLALSA